MYSARKRYALHTQHTDMVTSIAKKWFKKVDQEIVQYRHSNVQSSKFHTRSPTRGTSI